MHFFRFEKIQVNSNAIEQIVCLRKKSYLKKYQENVNLEGLNWNREDSMAEHFAAYQGERMISCLRLSKILSKEQFENTLEFSGESDFAFVPSFSLARAATLSEFCGHSINMRLREFVYQFIKDHYSEQQTYIYGTALAESRRLGFLKELGYELLIHERAWRRFLSSSGGKVAIFRLPLEKIDQAILRLRLYLANDHESFKEF